jgi:hypothetical protein
VELSHLKQPPYLSGRFLESTRRNRLSRKAFGSQVRPLSSSYKRFLAHIFLPVVLHQCVRRTIGLKATFSLSNLTKRGDTTLKRTLSTSLGYQCSENTKLGHLSHANSWSLGNGVSKAAGSRLSSGCARSIRALYACNATSLLILSWTPPRSQNLSVIALVHGCNWP